MKTKILKLREAKILEREELKKVTGGGQAASMYCCYWYWVNGVETCGFWVSPPDEHCP